MKKVLFCFLLILSCAVSIAQTSYKQNLLNGDVKMQEHLYDMALTYYQKAKAEASTPAEASAVEQRIRACERAMAPVEEEEPVVVSSKSKKLFSDQYLETGDIYDASIKNLTPSLNESDYPLSLYQIDVYRDKLVIVSHADSKTHEEVESLPAGTILPLVEETAEYRHYASGEDGESLVVFKKTRVNAFGRYRMIFREQDGQYFILFPMALVKKQMTTAPAKKAKEEAEPKKEEPAQAESAPILPITFTDHWILHFDEHGERIGDSRTAPIKARDAQWLMFRFRYTCPYSFKEAHRFDMKLVDPSGEPVVFDGKGAKTGYSASELLETIPGGGIFNIVVGSDTPGSFTKGEYRLSLYHGNNEYITVTFVLE